MILQYIFRSRPWTVAGLAVPVLALMPPLASAQAAASAEIGVERLEAVERFVERNWSRLGLPGVAVSVATGDSVLLARGYGSGTLDGEPITARTPFHLGSVTKTFTAALVVELAGAGVLDLDSPVETYVADFHMRAPYTPGSITLRHLLQHRSGLSQWSGHDSRAQQEGRFDHLAPAAAPGERGEYSSLNFIILGRVLEQATGESYGALVERLLFRPLGMSGGFVHGTGPRPPGLVQGHQSYFGVQVAAREPSPPRYLVPAGFVGASAYGLGRYGGMLVSGGEFAGSGVLDPEGVVELLGPLDEPGRALGWGRHRVDGTRVLEHSGNARTGSARIRLVPEDGYALVVLANSNSGPFFDATDALLDGAHRILEGETVADPWPAERLFKGALFLGTVLSVVGLVRRTGQWGRAGYPVGLDASTRTLARLALDVGGGAVLLFGLPRFIGVPLGTMFEYFPDLGIALSVSAGAGMVGGVLGAFTRSAQ